MPLIASVLGGVILLLGTVKTLTAETTGTELPAGHLLFFLGGSALAVYLVAAAGALIAGGIIGMAGAMGTSEESETVLALAAVAALGVAAVMLFAVVDAGVLWDYDDRDQFGRIVQALIGLAALALPVYMYRRRRSQAA